MTTKKQLEKYSKEELIQLCLLRDGYAKDNLKYAINLVEMALDKRNAEVKQVIEELGNDIGEDEESWKSHGKAFVKELLQKLGLGEK